MTKKYEKYSAERRTRLSPDGQEAIEVFSHAYAMGSALIQARQKRSLTQRALADFSGVQQADISRIERGILAPTTSTLMRLVEALDGRLLIELNPTNKKRSVGQSVVSAVVSRTDRN
jgi:ribosome-binding protein aMBF1 (putative translation factor)